MKKYYKEYLIILFVTGISALLRWRYLPTAPFWIDEYSSAHQAMLLTKYGLGIIFQDEYYFELIKLIPSSLIALSFKVFGVSELSARLPFLIIGTFVPPAVYLFFRRAYSSSSALSAGLFSACSYIMITWSQQARGYPLVQLYILGLFIGYSSIISTSDARKYLYFFTIALIGVFIHPFCLIALLSILIYTVAFSQYRHIRLLFALFFLIIGVIIACYGYLVESDLKTIFQLSVVQLSHNLPYYHSYLWRTQTLTTFLGIIGYFIAIRQFKNTTVFLGTFVLLYFFFIFYVFAPFVIRYLLPVMPILFGFAGIAVSSIGTLIGSDRLNTRSNLFVTFVLTILIILNGDTFSIKPKPFYSVNHEFREIAVLDYYKVYNLVKEKGNLDAGKTAMIDTWVDRANWYLGEHTFIYMFRWTDEGLMKKTPFTEDKNGNKVLVGRSGTGLVTNLVDLKKVQNKYPKGFIFIDDDTLPREVIDYAEKNMKKEIFIDHYALDDNPYSKWPATLYSWGMEESDKKTKK